MKKEWMICVLAIAALCALAPFASDRPDALQKLLGLPGGAAPFLKAVCGVLATVVVVLVLSQIFKYRKAHKA